MKFACLLAAALLVAAPASAQTASTAAPAASAPRYSAASTIGDLLANPEAKAVLVKHIPGILTHPQLNEALSMTVTEVGPYIGGDAVVNAIAADLALIK